MYQNEKPRTCKLKVLSLETQSRNILQWSYSPLNLTYGNAIVEIIGTLYDEGFSQTSLQDSWKQLFQASGSNRQLYLHSGLKRLKEV